MTSTPGNIDEYHPVLNLLRGLFGIIFPVGLRSVYLALGLRVVHQSPVERFTRFCRVHFSFRLKQIFKHLKVQKGFGRVQPVQNSSAARSKTAIDLQDCTTILEDRSIACLLGCLE